MRARLGPEWLRVYARARVRRAGRKRGFAPRRRSKLLQFLNSRSPGQRHDPPKPRASMPFGKVSAGFATVLRREPSPRYTSAEDPHRGGQLGLWCSPMCTQSVGPLGVYLWVRRTIRAKTVNQYNQLGGRGGGGDGGALNRPRAAACGQRAATQIAQAAQPGSPTPSPGPSGTWQDCVQMPRRARWLSG